MLQIFKSQTVSQFSCCVKEKVLDLNHVAASTSVTLSGSFSESRRYYDPIALVLSKLAKEKEVDMENGVFKEKYGFILSSSSLGSYFCMGRQFQWT